MSTFLLLISFLVAIALSIATSAATFRPGHIILLAGQNNMVGHGGVNGGRVWDGIVPSECKPRESITRLDVNLNWVLAREPIHAGVYNQPTGIGPGMPFAREILARNSSFGTIGLVPCALYRTSIARWQRGDPVYKNLIKRANASVNNGSKIEALLWWQGEADAGRIDSAWQYKACLIKFFQDVRSDLGLPNLRIIMVVIPPGRSKFTGLIRKAQLSLNLRNVEAVDPHELQLNQDGSHVSTQGQITVGRLLAKKFLSLS